MPPGVEEDVLRLEVAVDDVAARVGVQVLDGRDELGRVKADEGLGKAPVTLQVKKKLAAGEKPVELIGGLVLKVLEEREGGQRERKVEKLVERRRDIYI